MPERPCISGFAPPCAAGATHAAAFLPLRLLGLAAAPMLAIGASAASAANWVPVKSHSRGTLLIDTDSIQRLGSRVTLWIEARLPEPERTGVSYETDQWAIDCREMTVATLRTQQFGSGGRALPSDGLPAYYPERTAIVPNSTGFDIYRMVCR